jgi:hypothetical protein
MLGKVEQGVRDSSVAQRASGQDRSCFTRGSGTRRKHISHGGLRATAIQQDRLKAVVITFLIVSTVSAAHSSLPASALIDQVNEGPTHLPPNKPLVVLHKQAECSFIAARNSEGKIPLS